MTASADLIIRNLGEIATGDVDRPRADGDTVLIRDGLISDVGWYQDLDRTGIERELDAGGCTALPGLIDSHTHPVLGDYTPRQRMVDFIDSCLHGGVTSMISAGEAHTPGRPRDAEGVKALAVLAARSFANHRPSGVKVQGGAILLEPGLLESDFRYLAANGVRTVGEIGISGVNTPEAAEPMVRWAQAAGMRVLMHMGGASIPGSGVVGADFALTVRPDVAAHLNGGPTAPPLTDVERVLQESAMAIEVVQCGNLKALGEVVRLVAIRHEEARLLIGTDSPSGTGVMPLGMLRTISHVAVLGGMDPAVAIACATGNTARLHGLNRGILEPGREADLVLADAPLGSQAASALEALSIGDTPAVAAVLIDGQVRVFGSRNTPPAVRAISIPWMNPSGH